MSRSRARAQKYLEWSVSICLLLPAAPSVSRNLDEKATYSSVVDVIHSTLDSCSPTVRCTRYPTTKTVLKLGLGCRRRLGWRCGSRRCRGRGRGIRLRCGRGRSLSHRHWPQIGVDSDKLCCHPTFFAIAGYDFQPIAGVCPSDDLEPLPLFHLPNSTVIGTRPRPHIQDLGRYRGLRLRDRRRRGRSRW